MCTDFMGKLDDAKQEIIEYLLDEYQKKGKNFFFKSQNISSEKSIWAVGRAISELKKDGKVILWSDVKGKSQKLWRTNFEK